MDAAALQAQIATTLMAEPSTSPASTPSEAPVSETPQSPAETPATPPEAPVTEAPAEDEFEFPDETPKAPEAEAVTEPVEEKPAETDDAKLMNEETRKAFLASERGKRMYKGFQLAQAASKDPTEGGLGFVPTVDQLKEFHQDSQDLKLMRHEFNHGDQQVVLENGQRTTYGENWIKQHFTPGPDGYSNGAWHVARSIIPTVAEMAGSSPQAAALYREIARPAIINYIEERYRTARQEPEGEDRITALNVARILEEDITGKFREIPPEWLKGTPQQTAPDPRNAAIDAKVRRIDEFEQQQATRAEQHFAGTLNSAIGTKVMADVELALKPIAEGMTKLAYKATQKEFVDEVYRRVNSNPGPLRNYTIARDEARRAGTPAAVKAAADAWHSVARPVMKRLRAEYMADAGPKLVAQSDRRNEVLDEASQKRGTTGVAQPAEKSLAVGTMARLPGESTEAYIYRRTHAAVSKVG